jgi:hypothetical protein
MSPLAALRPGEVVAREEVFVSIEKDGVAACVSGRRNGDQLRIEDRRLVSRELPLDRPRRSSDVSFVQDPLASEAASEGLVLRDVVAMRQEHGADAPAALELRQEAADASRRIDKDVPLGSLDEVTPGAERVFGSESAEEDVLVDPLGVALDAWPRVLTRPGSDRAGRTGDERHQGGGAPLPSPVASRRKNGRWRRRTRPGRSFWQASQSMHVEST